MSQSLTILLAQINPTVGAIEANADKILAIIDQQQATHDLIIFPELVLTGYPPEDLLYRPQLYTRVEAALAQIMAATKHCHIIIGHPTQLDAHYYNSASIFYNGKRVALYHKQHLPNYGVFDEQRYFTPGPDEPCLLTVKGHRLGFCICEDLWQPGPAERLLTANVDMILSLNASPFDYGKYLQREQLLQTYAHQGIAICYVNLWGGQDELVFDGQSLVIDKHGIVCARAKAFSDHLLSINYQHGHVEGPLTPLLPQEALLYEALMCGLRDYVDKNNFPGVLLGLSGGIDSALVLAIAVDALGKERVQAIMMPSRYTAPMSFEDALYQAEKLDIAHVTIPIEPSIKALTHTLDSSLHEPILDLTAQNLQARIRGILLMALSNQTGKMVITTSNKSESAVGYTTLYGDMCGGFAPLQDVFKTQVYALARYRNQISSIIPERVLTRPPSAELAPNQTDQDSLPDYTLLDQITQLYMESQLDAEALIRLGFPTDTVHQVIRLIKRNEYKRRQAPPGIKITHYAFGRDWRYPITSGF